MSWKAEDAVTLMEHLPPAGWSDVARKSDLEALKAERIALFRGELATALTAQTRMLVFLVLGAVTSVGVLVLAATG